MYKREQDITPKSKLLWSSSNSHCIITADKGGHGENECVVGRDQAGAAVGLVVGAEVVGEVNGDTVGPGVVGESVGLVVGSALVGEIDGELVGVVVVGPVPGASVREGEGAGVGRMARARRGDNASNTTAVRCARSMPGVNRRGGGRGRRRHIHVYRERERERERS